MADHGAQGQAVCTVAKPFSNGVFYHESPFRDAIPLFMLQVIVTGLVSRLVYFVLRPLKQPRIVCDIIGGMLVGNPVFPWLLSRLPFVPPGTFDDSIKHYRNFLFREDVGSLLRTLGAYGLMLKFFLIGVKIDPSNIWRCGKKAAFIGICSMVLPWLASFPLSWLLFKQEAHFDKEENKVIVRVAGVGLASTLMHLSATISAASPSVVADVLADLRLLNTELGRLAISASMINELTRWSIFAVYDVIEVNRIVNNLVETLQLLGNSAAILIGILVVFRPWVLWIVRKVPKGGRVGEADILMVMIAALVIGVVSDGLGFGFMDAPMLMGLLVPDGPPLGMALVERLELISTELLLQLFYVGVGWATSFASIQHPKALLCLLLFFLVGHLLKILVAMVPAVYYKTSIRNAALLGLMLNFKGLVEIVIYLNLKNMSELTKEAHLTAMVALVLSTAICSLLVSTFYDPLNSRNMVGWRTLQYLKPHEQFSVVTSMLNEDPVPILLNLMEVSCVEDQSSICAYVLHLVELGGRSSSSLIAHRNRKGEFNDSSQMDRLHNAFVNYEKKKKKGSVVVQPFTAICPYSTMHQDICSLAMEKNVPFIIVPFPRKDSGANSELDQATRSIIPQVLSQAPCSVGILVHHTLTSSRPMVPEQFVYRVRVLFWGGHDDREALSYAGRMARHPGVHIFITRFMPEVSQKEDRELTWDDMLFKEFMRENKENERVVVEEITVTDADQAISVIRSVDKDYDLVVVGRRQCSWSMLDEALAEWIESPELGVVGDMLASADFSKFSFSVLVVQQHV